MRRRSHYRTGRLLLRDFLSHSFPFGDADLGKLQARTGTRQKDLGAISAKHQDAVNYVIALLAH